MSFSEMEVDTESIGFPPPSASFSAEQETEMCKDSTNPSLPGSLEWLSTYITYSVSLVSRCYTFKRVSINQHTSTYFNGVLNQRFPSHPQILLQISWEEG